jgi:NAD-dependent SIR2 family protein deacetylase
MEVEMVCKECGKTFMVSAHTFEEHEDDGSLDYCPECTDFLKVEEVPLRRCFEYTFVVAPDLTILNVMGAESWELIFQRDGIFYFQREYAKEV